MSAGPRRRSRQRKPVADPLAALGSDGQTSLGEAIKACPYRSILSRDGRQAPILNIWAVLEGPALPLPPQALADAEDALNRGGAFLLMAVHRADRDVAKAALALAMAPSRGNA